jgi:hypothetical protein
LNLSCPAQVWTEQPAEFPRVGAPTWGSPVSADSALEYKLGRAAGDFNKPHWGIVTLTGCGLAPTAKPPQTMTVTLGAAEAAAGGGVAALLVGDVLGDDACEPAARAWAAFVDGRRALFGADRRKPCANQIFNPTSMCA